MVPLPPQIIGLKPHQVCICLLPFLFLPSISSSQTPVPQLEWSTYLGGGEIDWCRDVIINSSGEVIVTGFTTSSSWIQGGSDTDYNEYGDAFVAVFSPGGQMVWSSYLGGGHEDEGFGVAVDGNGNIYVAGATASPGWIHGGSQTTYMGGGEDGFLVKLSSSGQHIWSTYIGGSEEDRCSDITIDSEGNLVVAGYTRSPGWAQGGYDLNHAGGKDGFVVKLNPSGTPLWSTYLGGEFDDMAYGIIADESGNIFACGSTGSDGWVSGGARTSLWYWADGFVAKITASGTHVWSTFIGGAIYDDAQSISVTASGKIAVSGLTDGNDWISGGYDTSYDGGASKQGFALVLNGDSSTAWSTYVPHIANYGPLKVAVGSDENILVTGFTEIDGWPQTGFDLAYGGLKDGFILSLSPSGAHVWSSYLGGTQLDQSQGIAVDPLGNIYLCGETRSEDWISGGHGDLAMGEGFLLKIGFDNNPETPTPSETPEPTETPSPSSTNTPIDTPTEIPTSTQTPTNSEPPSPSMTPTESSTSTPPPTATSTGTPTFTTTQTPTNSETPS
ncbi:SBBP repeat-containing protein, partial [bacterium]|nr:SBBP repeat-containing protein [bacterium]